MPVRIGGRAGLGDQLTYIHGLHEPGGEHLMADKPGWIVFTERLFHNPNDYTGRDYRQWSDRGFNILVRLNNDYYPGGTIPEQEHYTDFAKRCANFVQASQGCTRWIIGNEPNHEQEWPNGQMVTAAQYAACFDLCATEIHDHRPDDEVIVAAIAPWNVQAGDWLEYFEGVLSVIGWPGGIALHTYTHGSDPALVTSHEKMTAPGYEDRFYHFRAYWDFMARVPSDMYHLPFYITETNQGDQPWEDVNSGWVNSAYLAIDSWNQTGPDRIIHALCLYRWPKYDQWYIDGKQGVIADFQAAVERGYTVPGEPEMPESENKLVNGGMEHEYEYQLDQWGHPIQTVLKPHGWTAYWLGVLPEFKPVEPQYTNRIHGGATAAQWFKNYDTPNGGLYQVVTGLQPGKTYRLSGYGQVWAIYKNGNDVPASMETRVNPYGATDVDDAANLRSAPIHPHNAYKPFNDLEFVAKSDRATVFVLAIFQDPGQDMNAYVDTMSLVCLDCGDEPPDPDPPDPPVPGECDLKTLYAANAQAERRLAETHDLNADMWETLATG